MPPGLSVLAFSCGTFDCALLGGLAGAFDCERTFSCALTGVPLAAMAALLASRPEGRSCWGGEYALPVGLGSKLCLKLEPCRSGEVNLCWAGVLFIWLALQTNQTPTQ